MKRLLLLRPDKAGDALKTLPALRALTALEVAEVHLLTSRHNHAIFEYEPNVTAHLMEEALPESLPKDLDVAVNLQCDVFESTLALLQKIPARKKYSVQKEKRNGVETLTLASGTPALRDECLNIAELLECATRYPIVERVELTRSAPQLGPEDIEEAERALGPKEGRWLGICPFAGLAQRSHSMARWNRLVQRVTKDRTAFSQFFLFGAPSDTEALERMRGYSRYPEQTHVVQASHFRALAAYFARLDGVVAVDSGPLHLAQAMGTRSLGILSGGDFRRWYPRLAQEDRLVKRGWLGRFPTVLEMSRAYRQWLSFIPEKG